MKPNGYANWKGLCGLNTDNVASWHPLGALIYRELSRSLRAHQGNSMLAHRLQVCVAANLWRSFLALSAVLMLGGCCTGLTKGVPPDAKFVPLGEAIKQVQTAVAESRKAAPDQKIGVLVSKVTVSLKLAATDTSASTAGATLGISLPPVAAGGTVSQTASQASSSENTITLEFSSPLLASKDSMLSVIATEPDPKKREALLKYLQSLGAIESLK
jgi:hypothetical protein